MVLIPIQFILTRLNLPFWNVMPRGFYKLLAVFFGLKVKVIGKVQSKYPTLLVANHISWLDIIAIGSVANISFIAKSEIAKWPLVGFFASLQKTIFVARTRKTDTKRTSNEMAKRLNDGGALVLFAEGGSNNGRHLMPFRSALVGAVFATMKQGEKQAKKIVIQPLTIAYTKIQGLQIPRFGRSNLAWNKSVSVKANIKKILNSDVKQVIISFGQPIEIKASDDRKKITKLCEAEVRKTLVALNRGEIS